MCNGSDDDCDGSVDGLEREAPDTGALEVCGDGRWEPSSLAAPSSSWLSAECSEGVHVGTVSGAELVDSYEYCEPTEVPDDITCALATDLLCEGCGASAGLGPLASTTADDRHTVGCLGAEFVERRSVDFDSLVEELAGCEAADPGSVECALAAASVCEAEGLLTGFGPSAYTSEGIELVCTPSAELVEVRWSDLDASGESCSLETVRYLPCRTAIAIACRDRGHLLGFGPVALDEGDEELLTIACLGEPP